MFSPKCNISRKFLIYISGKEVFFFWGLTSITLKKISKEFWYQTIVDKIFCNICWKFATIIMHLVKGILKKSIFFIFHVNFCAFWMIKNQNKYDKSIATIKTNNFCRQTFFQKTILNPSKLTSKIRLIYIFCDFDHF